MKTLAKHFGQVVGP